MDISSAVWPRPCCFDKGSVDFESLDAYRIWIANLIGRRNARRGKVVQLECAALRGKLAAAGRTTDYDEGPRCS